MTDRSGTPNSTDAHAVGSDGIQPRPASSSTPATNTTEKTSESSTITAQRGQSFFKNFRSKNASRLRQSSLPSEENEAQRAQLHSTYTNDQSLPEKSCEMRPQSPTSCFGDSYRSPYSSIWKCEASSSSSGYYLRPDGSRASNHPMTDLDRFSNLNNAHILPYAYTYAPSARSTFASIRPTEGAYVATNPFRAHRATSRPGAEWSAAVNRDTFDDIPTKPPLPSMMRPSSAPLSASQSAYSLDFPSIIRGQSHPTKTVLERLVQPESLLRPQKSSQKHPSTSLYAVGHSTTEKNAHLLDEKPFGNGLAALDQREYDKSSVNVYSPQHLAPNAPSVPSVAPPNPPHQTHHPDSLGLNDNEESHDVEFRANGLRGRLFSLKLNDRRRIYESASFMGETVLRQIYLHFLLRLPSLYFSRVARIFEEADLTVFEIQRMALEIASQGSANLNSFDALTLRTDMTTILPQYERLKTTWESFIDNVMREWKTLNILSALLLSAILTILQISGAADDPVTRYAALLSLVCALLSLLFGCMYIIRFGSMRKTYKAAEWALEATRTKAAIWWNVWVLLAMPAFWLTWSIILYIVCIMSFIWRTNAQSTQASPTLSNKGLLIVRIFISSVLGLGLFYGVLVFMTFNRYGETMERAWKRKINGWVQEKMLLHGPASCSAYFYEPSSHPAPSGQYQYLPEIYSQSPPTIANNASYAVSAKSPLHVAQSNTHHARKPASVLSESTDPRKRFNPPGYAPTGLGGQIGSQFEDQSLTPKRGQVAASSLSIRKTDFHASSEIIPPAAKLDATFTNIPPSNAPASDGDSAKIKYNSHSRGPPNLVDEDEGETSEQDNRDPDTGPVLPAIPSDWVPRSFHLQELRRSENDRLSAFLTREQNAASPSQSSLCSDAPLGTNVKQDPPEISLSTET